MAVSINELLAKKEEIAKRKAELYDLETSVGTITVKKPSNSLLATALDMEERNDEFLIVESVVSPNLKDKSLLDGFDCFEPLDVVNALFEVGEIRAIAGQILKLVGMGKTIETKLHDEVKN